MPIAVRLRSTASIFGSDGRIIHESPNAEITATVSNKCQESLLTRLISNSHLELQELGSGQIASAHELAVHISALRALLGHGLLDYQLISQNCILAECRLNSASYAPPWFDKTVDYVLVPHIFMTFNAGEVLIRSPFAKWIMYIRQSGMHLCNFVASLQDSSTQRILSKLSPAECDLLELFVYIGLLIPTNTARSFSGWEFHDALFHYNSRIHNDLRVRGGTFPLKGSLPPPATYEPKNSSPFCVLDNAQHREEAGNINSSFFEVLAQRRSSHLRNSRLDLQLLREVASESFGVQQQVDAPIYQFQRRPFPSAGGLHELELFCVAGCEIAESDLLLYFDAINGEFRTITADGSLVRSLLLEAQACWGAEETPRALFIIGARYIRVAWKYQSMAYRSILLNAGCAMQTIALVSTAFGLCGCPAGNGNSELFSQILNENECHMSSVAEFAFA